MIARAGIALAERGLVPLPLLRAGIRRLCAQRLVAVEGRTDDAFLASLAGAPVADVPALANEQHYEVPAALFQIALGRHLKYSSAWWPAGVETLDAAEEAMLALTCERAELVDGQDVLELGCGWGSLSLFMARRFPRSRITAVSNSATQREFIMTRAPSNLRVVTADMNAFTIGQRFDRVVSVEMFEHMRDWPTLLERVAGWLAPHGKLFIHVFCHARHAYVFETTGSANWMGRHFFTGGIMPSLSLMLHPSLPFEGERSWWMDGTHYQRTAAAWRANLERRRGDAMDVLRAHYGADAHRWFHRWRIFFLACEELFGYAGGSEWGVGHYLLTPRPAMDVDRPARVAAAQHAL